MKPLTPGPWRPTAAPSARPLTARYEYWSTTTTDLDGPTYPGFATTNTVFAPSGTNGVVAVPALNLNTNTVTMECWIKRNGDQPSFAGILFHRGGSGTATGMDFHDVTDDLGYHWSDQASTYDWDSGLQPPDGAWTYAALAVGPTQAVMFMYDGTNWSAATNLTSHPVQPFAATLQIGADGSTTRYYNGLLDEAAIYASTLTEGQLHTHALAGFGGTQRAGVADRSTHGDARGHDLVHDSFSVMADAYGQPPLIVPMAEERHGHSGSDAVHLQQGCRLERR